MKKLIFIGILVTIFVIIVLAPHASSFPDGLEKVAIKYGFVEMEKELVKSPFADYQVKVTQNEKVSTALAGLVGSIVVFAAVFLFFKLTGKRNETPFFR